MDAVNDPIDTLQHPGVDHLPRIIQHRCDLLVDDSFATPARMSDTVVNFSDMVFRLRGAGAQRLMQQQRCQHKHLTLDDEGELVLCNDCGKQVSAFWALRRMALVWDSHAQAQRRAVAQIQADQHATFHLRAAKLVERAWRRRDMVPVCPHCRAGILPEDGLGHASINRAVELSRRAATKDRDKG